MMSPALTAAVASHSFTKGMAPEHVRLLTNCAMLTRFEAGQSVFREGEVANRFYLIVHGKVSLEKRIEGNGLIPIQALGPGDILGWSWLFPPYYWHFDACALEPTEVIFFYGTRLRESCEDDPQFGYELMKRITSILMSRLQSTVRKSLELLKPAAG